MSKRIDDRIARKICGWKYDAKGESWVGNNRHECADYDWSPSTDIASAIEALEHLPKGWGWQIGKRSGGTKFGNLSYYCTLWATPCSLSLVEGAGTTKCSAICRALLHPRVLAAVKAARKVKPRKEARKR